VSKQGINIKTTYPNLETRNSKSIQTRGPR